MVLAFLLLLALAGLLCGRLRMSFTAAFCTDHESCLLFPSCVPTQPKVFAGHGAALRLIIILCVGILTLLPIKALIYLVEKTFAATEEKPFPNKCSCCV